MSVRTHEYWTPGRVLPENVTAGMREHPTGLRHHHIVVSAVFTGQGHQGLILTQYQTQEWVIWTADVYGALSPIVISDVKREGPGTVEEIKKQFGDLSAALFRPEDDE